jgi:xylulokinase
VFLGIDIGTSGIKAVIITSDGNIIDSSTAALSVSRPHPGWSEQHPADWWEATEKATLSLKAENRSAVKGIGLSGQMHGATLLDKEDQVLRPAILWNDGRSESECRDLQRNEPDFVRKGGNLVMPGFTAPKLEWVRRHEPEIFDKIAKVLLPKDYVRLQLTGTYASDMSDSAGTLWMDVEKRDWHDPLLNACGLSRDHMPALYEGTEVTGTLRPELARSWGISEVPVYAGGGDNAAGAAATGAVNTGDTLMSLGTSGVIFTASDTYYSNPDSAIHAFCHAVPDRWHLMSVMLSAASCLDWATKLVGLSSVADLIHLAETKYQKPVTEIFLPYLSGERTPLNDPQAQGVFFGLTHETGAAELAQAVLEGVAFGMADGFDGLIKAGADIDTISVIGGGSQSAYWGKILSSAIGRTLVYRDGAAVGPAVGAARLAAYGTINGATVDAFEQSFTTPPIMSEISPDISLSEAFAVKRSKYSNIYKNLKSSFSGVSND